MHYSDTGKLYYVTNKLMRKLCEIPSVVNFVKFNLIIVIFEANDVVS